MEVITTHLNADFDGLAAMVAAQKLYPDAVLAFPGSREKNVRDYFEQSGQIFHFQRTKNIELDQVTRLIVVDTRQSSRIGVFAQCLKNPGIEVHLYDHHPDAPGDMKGDLELVKPVGATTTLFTQLFEEKKIPITTEEATLLGMALHEDTGSFLFDSTTPDDLEAMSWLLAHGANVHTISQSLSKELTVDEIALLHNLIKSATTYMINGIAIAVANLALDHYVDEFALLVRRFMMMENLNNLFALASMEGRVYLIARSRIPEVNVGKIAMEFGGGGHASAASATIKNMTLIEAEENLVHYLHKHVRPEQLARELMSAPVISVDPAIPIREANKILTRYNITVLPVVTDQKKIVGIISRRVTEKAIFHALGDFPVSDYMTTDFASLAPSSSLADIQELIIENRQRFIPVIDKEKIVGVITRTDLLNVVIQETGQHPQSMMTSPNQHSIDRQRNLNTLMVEMLPRDKIVLLQTVGEVAEKNGYAAYAVGGFVRDLLLRIKNLDLDIVIEGNGIQFAKIIAKQLGGKIRTHEKFNTAVVILPDGFKIDIATARLEYYEHPAAMPTIEMSSIKLDLFRRDFTINAMAIHLNPDTFGTLIDFFNCQNDIKDRQIRILHNLSFVEDPTRVFRAIRLEQRMGFQLGKHTEKLIKNAVKMNLFDRIAGNRLLTELQLILSEEYPLPAIRRMAQFDLLKFLHPALRFDSRLEQILEETNRALAWHKLLYLDEPCEQWLVYFLAVAAELGLKEMLALCTTLAVPDRFKNHIKKTKTEAGRVIKSLDGRRPLRPSEIYWLLHDMSHEGLLYLMGISRKNGGKKAVSLYVTQLRHVTPEINGADLMKLGYKSGPIFRTILDSVLEAKLDGLLASKDDEMAFVKKKYPVQDKNKPAKA
jgi:tRNA nucleotidyltransferase (CCA-adding enzyme)